ncbi:MAG: Crp/Fnr family transcriptional regulator [bacterium]
MELTLPTHRTGAKSQVCSDCPSRLANIFCPLEGKSVQRINAAKISHLFKKKQTLFTEGNPAVGLYCIQSGRVKGYKTSPEGKQYIIRLFEPGDVVGLPAIFIEGSYSWSAEVVEEGAICFIPREPILETIRENPKMATKIMETLAEHLEEANTERAQLAYGAVRERMARLLSLLSQTHGVKAGRGTRIALKLSREELAEMIGTAAETAIRLLSEFKEEKILEMEGKEIIILKSDNLLKTAGLAD